MMTLKKFELCHKAEVAKKKIHLPKKGAGRELAAKLKSLGNQMPLKELVNKINNK
jgi:hypothetical protein